ncbi:diguanylate cyclase domain-containing protein [Terasakiella pusilla]|uniref:diguanylate cyclase domain-containing protein n=1 Tax=Terasakiella pusilla TaxID=64973 RepID=UPI003AA9827D
MSNHHIANLILATTNTKQLEDVSAQLKQNNYTVIECSGDVVDTIAQKNHPDLILIDVSCDDFDGFEVIKALKNIADIAHIPIVAISREKSNELYTKSLEHHVDDMFIYPFDVQEFLLHIQSLLRLSTMYMERDNRFKLARQHGINAQAETDFDVSAPHQILLIGPIDGDRAAIETILDGNCNVDICSNVFEAEEQLANGFYDACICHLDATNTETVLSLSTRIRNNPRLFNLPVLVLSNGEIEDRIDAYRRGITRIVKRPLNLSSLKAKLVMLVRRQRLRWNLRNAIETTRDPSNTDAITNAYTKDFFNENLLLQVKNAQLWKKHHTVIFFSIVNLPSVEEQFGETASQELLQQIHQWITNLSRVEDMVSRYGPHDFCISLPDTPLEEAQLVMHRIAGILSYTDFALGDVFQPISVWVETGIATLEKSDDMNSLLNRAHHRIQ